MRRGRLRDHLRRVSLAAALVPTLVAPAALSGPGAPVAAAAPGFHATTADALHAPGGYWVILRARADLSGAAGIRSWDPRGAYVMRRLTATANAAQRRVRALLAARGVRYQAFWAIDAIRVLAGDTATRRAIAALPEVARIEPAWSARVEPAAPGFAPGQASTVEWNVIAIRAQRVWKRFGDRGEGIVVANIDTGVQFDHPALVRQYRGNLGGGTFNHSYDWFDPSHACPQPEPCDNVAHGTHTMGTAVGDDRGSNRIGVAPRATWIAAKGCENNSCSDTALVASGQWMLAPTNLNGHKPRPDLRPDVVSNSWSTEGSNDFYRQIVQDWVASGIFPVFSGGSGGPTCGTIGSPASYPESYGVGAFDMADHVASFSSRGPSPFGGAVKPNVAAPGINVRSSVPTDGYSIYSGTSMATPHAAGTVALMWSAQPVLRGDIDGTRSILDATAADRSDLTCGGDPGNNNVWGEGRLDAFAAVKAARLGAGSSREP